MKSEEELREYLKKCEQVRGFGLSSGSCPFEENGERGCCAECSTPSTIKWILEEKNKPTDNMQNILINAFKGVSKKKK